MIKLLCVICLFSAITISASASEMTAPVVPKSGLEIMPEQTESFSDALLELAQNCVQKLQPDLQEAVVLCIRLLMTAVVFSVVPVFAKRTGPAVSAAAAAAIFTMIFHHADTLIRLASDTVYEICEYGKLLCPIMTTALSAQGAVSSAASLYMGTMMFTALLGTLISRCFIPMVYAFLVFSATNSVLGEEYLRKFADAIKNVLSWLLKSLMIVFTTYMSITGVITGTTDAASMKAAKVAMSTVVPVVGSILSDASEAVLVSLGLMKNAAGIYGIIAALAVFLGPFLKVGIQYLVLKFSSAICSIFSEKRICTLISDLSTALGLLLAMIAASCTMVLISTVCFLKGAG